MIKLMVEDYLEDYPYWRSVTVPIEDKQLFIDGIHELGLDWKLGHKDGNGRIGLKIYCEQDDLVNLADYVDSRKAKTESIGRKRLREQDVEIEVKNKGILEVPENKNVDDLPMSHFEKLVKKHGLSKITKALNNLQVWNKNDDKELSKWAGNMIDKLTKKFGKNESLYDYYDMPNSAFNVYDDIPDEPFTEEDEFNYYVDYVYNHTRNPQEAVRYLRSEGKSKEYIDQVIAAVDEIYG